MPNEPFTVIRSAAIEARKRIQKLDNDLRRTLADESVRLDQRQKRANELRAKAREDVAALTRNMRSNLRDAANKLAPSHAVNTYGGNVASAAARSLYVQRAAAMLQAGDVRGIRQAIEQAIRAGDSDVAQEYLNVAGSRLASEYGAAAVRALRNAAVPKYQRSDVAIHHALERVVGDDEPWVTLQRHVDKLLDQAGKGDPYDEPDPQLGRQLTLWVERVEQQATDYGVQYADTVQRDIAAVTSGQLPETSLAARHKSSSDDDGGGS